MNRLKLISGVIIIFLVGALAGSLGTSLYIKHKIERFEFGGPPPKMRTAFLLKRLSDELDLSDRQREEIQKIIEESQAKILTLRREFFPEIKTITDQTFALIREKLDDTQKPKLDALYEKLKRMRGRIQIPKTTHRKSPEQIISEMKARLELTEAQASRLLQIYEESIEEKKKIIEKHQMRERPDDPLMQREIGELEKSFEARIGEVLTKTQMAKFRKLNEEHGMHFHLFRPRPY